MRSTTAICRACSAWWPTCWMRISGTSAPSGVWRGEFGSTPPFDIGPDSLVVGYSLWAEMTCFLTLGWRFPVHVYDLHTAFLGDKQHPTAVRAGRGPQEAAQAPVGCLSRLRHRGLGEHRQAGHCQGDRRRPLARIRPRGGVQLLRGGRRASRQNCCGVSSPATAAALPSIPGLSCTGASTAPRPSRGSRPTACRSTCRCGTLCRRTSWRSLAR